MTGSAKAPAVSLPRRTSGRTATRVVAYAAAVLFVLHGIAHAVGFSGTFGLSEANAIADGYTLVTGLDPDGVAMHALGLLWLAPIPLYAVAAAGLAVRRNWWWGWALAATLASLALCVLWLEPARIGLAVNAVILAGLAIVALQRRRAAQ